MTLIHYGEFDQNYTKWKMSYNQIKFWFVVTNYCH
jgi:hypothetical protein